MARLHPAFALLGLAAIAAAGFAQAQTQPAAGGLEPIVLARQAALDMSAVTFVEMKHAAESGGDVKSQVTAANALHRWAQSMPALFPAGTAVGQVSIPTKARPEIWTNRAGFEARAADYASATAKLAQLAQSGDAPGFSAQLDVVKKACGACHTDFQAR